MWKFFVSISLAVSILFMITGCESQDKDKEINRLISELDANLKETHELQAELDSYKEREESYKTALGAMFTVTNEYREDLADIKKHIMNTEDLPAFSPSISESHRNVMYEYFTDRMEKITSDSPYMGNPQPIYFVLHVDTLKPYEVYRTKRDNCEYYDVTFYQSLIYPYDFDTISGIPRGLSDGLISHWLIEVENKVTGPEVTDFAAR